MFERYRVSSCHHREKNSSNPRHSRATGPAPSWAPCSNADRNIAKFSEMRVIPRLSAFNASSLTISSMVPLGELGDRRIKSSDTPVVPHGTSDSIATTLPSRSMASTSRQSPSAGSPSRPSAMEKPRSVWVSRQASARAMVSAIASGEMSRCRRIRTVNPARRARVTAWRTPRMSGPDSLNSEVRRMASSPSSSALRPASR
ncbi:hypothetical protein PICSAR181_01480 [Mycobacterium avium subsp. paratuberculosis]|nr:hypothetical protein PICSAR14_04132 [Mycobacterium avium subsp. paratuberculosis]CAG7038138.1 hypothetical protein PICSAR179_00957 [Mycobacterium avium subsp. paratuberculosis]CAG7048095.1 hypothetical protein PICSAR181_01480 [Mycobacterium avium subsp. paratuberculosis]CAG7240448.1 hypothetical protein PICSAR26_02831 [Mycobacterium avium subsp. paratuberculosis]CAG7385592.1 hypothetical protein PICSAR7_03537 [Mycobacterium avium subsp. paratuberculosis]